MATTKAEIEGLKTATKEQVTETDKVSLDEILENTKQAYMVDLTLSQEAAKMALGEYTDEYIYNVPRASNQGKEDWGALCDKMPNGYCYYRTNKIKHIHTVGVNINGAIAIMNAYMGLSIKPSDPVIKEFTILQDGKLINKSYWSTIVHITNKKTETELDLPFLQDVMQKTGNGYMFNEYGSQICVSKGMRNAILKVVPENFQKTWIEEYKGNGKQEKTGKKEKPTNKPDDAETDKPGGNSTEMTAESAIEHINEIDNISHLINWYNKNSAWMNKLKADEKTSVIDAYNAKHDILAATNANKNNQPNDEASNADFNPATKPQYDTIMKLSEKKGYDREQLDAACKVITGIEDVADMSFEQASLVIAELQK
jgi:hypothetical protein